jgi:hypothetical protein
METYALLEQEFMEVKDIMDKQGLELSEKRTEVQELIDVMERLKSRLFNYEEELGTSKKEQGKLLKALE